MQICKFARHMPLFTFLWKLHANHLAFVFYGTGACWPHFSFSFDTSFVPNGGKMTKSSTLQEHSLTLGLTVNNRLRAGTL